ncbi:MAG: aspartate carbamoyltransferase catalytic subunit [Nitrospinae bacterium]|nr:aspartate carbamoyltransferase catalytic subunit [Nitrospinota bacterium]
MGEARLLNRRLVSMRDLTEEDIEQILSTAKVMKDISTREVKKAPPLRGRTIINCFLEASTRTRTSFEIAGKRLSADVINISGSSSSMIKGESLKDTVSTLESMQPDLIVLRAANSGAAEQVSHWVDCPVVNAGDGRHEHPTQALLDLMTITEQKGYVRNLNISIIGDISNSRVARSNLISLNMLGANTTVCGPSTLLPREVSRLAGKVTTKLSEAVEGADVIMMLRIQQERMAQAKFPTLREYSVLYGLSEKKLAKAKKDVIIMHPGPINRGVEISPQVADGPWSVILDQVTNGVAVRMAILYLLLGGGLKAS